MISLYLVQYTRVGYLVGYVTSVPNNYDKMQSQSTHRKTIRLTKFRWNYSEVQMEKA